MADGPVTNTQEGLEALALSVREHIVRMATNGGCFIGASLSCADLLVHLYTRVLRVSPSRLDDPDRDILLLSKGHDVPALYGTLAELGGDVRQERAPERGGEANSRPVFHGAQDLNEQRGHRKCGGVQKGGGGTGLPKIFGGKAVEHIRTHQRRQDRNETCCT